MVPPRLPGTHSGVSQENVSYSAKLLILPSVPSFSPIIKHTARISVLPIKLNLVERARIYAINLDDYQLDPLYIPPPSTLYTYSQWMIYQRMIAVTDPHRGRSSNMLRRWKWPDFDACSCDKT
ncbi:hypothetical protein Tco_0849025 [Tanacetum coccineum]